MSVRIHLKKVDFLFCFIYEIQYISIKTFENMKKMKVENVSNVKLDFFLKQNNSDVRIAIGPGESSWCDEGSATRSMILYKRKSLIKIFSEEGIEVNDISESIEDIKSVGLDLIPNIPMSPPDVELFKNITFDTPEEKSAPDLIEFLNKEISEEIEVITPLEKAQKETEDYKKESEKIYKGKKRGRKKKRGPKPGSKKNKVNNLPTISENNSDGEITGSTNINFSD